jgi:hypothetical protein
MFIIRGEFVKAESLGDILLTKDALFEMAV